MGNHVGHLGLLALVVGCSSEPSGPPPVQNYCDGLPVVSDTRARTLTDFGTPAPAGYAQALAIAPNGDLAGNGLFSGVQGSFRYTRAGQLIRLDHVTDFPTSVPAALSSGGRVFGRAFSPLGPFVGVVWESNGGVASISAPSGATFVPAAAAGSDLAAGTLFFSGGLSPKAAIWRQGNVTSLGTLAPGDGQSSAGAVNAVGQVVGTTQTSAAPTSDVFVWTEAAGMKAVGRPAGSIVAQASAVNDCGVIAGTASTSTPGENRPWRWTAAGGFVPLALPGGATTATVTGIDSLGVVYGNVSSGGISTPYVWYRNGGEALPGGSELVVRGVNACGAAVGTFQQTSNDGRIAVWARPGC